MKCTKSLILNSSIIITLFYFLGIPNVALAQEDLRKDQAFFQNRSKDYSQWLRSSELGNFFKFEKIGVTREKVTISLLAKFKGEKSGDSLKVAWRALRKKFFIETSQDLHEVMLSKMSFQMETSLLESEIVIRAVNPSYKIRIFGEKSGFQHLTARWEELGDKAMGNGSIQIPVGELKNTFKSDKEQFGNKSGVNLPKVRKAIKSFINDRYIRKSSWIWRAKIDTTNSYSNELTYDITHISGEILKSHKFYELHQIHFLIEADDKGLNVSWDFQAKYGGGLVFPPRNDSNDYHDFEASLYKDQFKTYQHVLFQSLRAKLKSTW